MDPNKTDPNMSRPGAPQSAWAWSKAHPEAVAIAAGLIAAFVLGAVLL